MTPILHSHLPHTPWGHPATRRLPGIQPLDPADWLRVDEAYGGQMALREQLIADRLPVVHALDPAALPAGQELLARVLTDLPRLGFEIGPHDIRCPDGRVVPCDRGQPLITLGRLCQQDFCLMQKRGTQHVLTGAILCFPASWTLAAKFLRPMTGVHAPVDVYDHDLARRVQRMFDMIRPDQPLWRANALLYENPDLHSPRTEAAPRIPPSGPAPFLRSERQCLLRLPVTDAVVFSIHTYLIHIASLSVEQRVALGEHSLHRVNG